MKRKLSIITVKCQYKVLPSPVNECTEVSPKTPVLVKKVEYKTSKKESTINRKLALREWPVCLKINMV